MLNLFQRALIRAGINPHYSQGFNPRPKISLPLPRPVGVESDDELLVMAVNTDYELTDLIIENSNTNLDNNYEKRFFKDLSAQLPEGCELQSVNIVPKKPSFQPCLATYRFTLRQEYMTENLRNKISNILTSKSLIAERSIDTKGRPRSGLEDSESHPSDKPGRSAAKKIDLRVF